MTALEYIQWALDEEVDIEEALSVLSRYMGKNTTYYNSFPDADVLTEDNTPLEDLFTEPDSFQEYWKNSQTDDILTVHYGRPRLSDEDKRKPRSIKFSDKEWNYLRTQAEEYGLPISEFIRLKTLV